MLTDSSRFPRLSPWRTMMILSGLITRARLSTPYNSRLSYSVRSHESTRHRPRNGEKSERAMASGSGL